jgi:hypothetical protein
MLSLNSSGRILSNIWIENKQNISDISHFKALKVTIRVSGRKKCKTHMIVVDSRNIVVCCGGMWVFQPEHILRDG